MSSTVPAEVPSPVRDQSSTHAEDSDYFGVLSRKRLSSGSRSSTSRPPRVVEGKTELFCDLVDVVDTQIQERVGPRVAGVLAEEEPHAPPRHRHEDRQVRLEAVLPLLHKPSCRYPAAARATAATRRIGITSSTDPGSPARP